MRVVSKRHLLGDIGAVAAVCMAVSAVVCAGGVRAAESVASNLDMMTDLTANVVGELYGKFGASLGDRVLEVRPYASSEDYVFVSNVFVAELSRAGVRTIRGTQTMAAPQKTGNAAADSLAAQSLAGPGGQAGSLELVFTNVAFAVVYPDVYRSHLIGGKKIRREAEVRVFATLSDRSSGEVLWTGEASRSHADEFDKDDVLRIESGTYSFLRPTVPSSGWGKYVEPVFVTGIVVGLIYLFFANQSDN